MVNQASNHRIGLDHIKFIDFKKKKKTRYRESWVFGRSYEKVKGKDITDRKKKNERYNLEKPALFERAINQSLEPKKNEGMLFSAFF